MKNYVLMLVLSCSVLAGSAQYKKAGYFGKGGRTYTLGSTVHMIGDGKGSPVGFYFGSGIDRTEKRLVYWYELEAIPPFKYSYETTGKEYDYGNEVPVTVSGKSKFHLLLNYNLGYHFLDRSEEEPRLQPFAFGGINILLLGRADEPDYGVYDPKKAVSTSGMSLGLRGGVGTMVKLTEVIQVKVMAGYNWQYNKDNAVYPGAEAYYMFTSNVFASAGIQFRLKDN